MDASLPKSEHRERLTVLETFPGLLSDGPRWVASPGGE